jgi:hypothetical protein
VRHVSANCHDAASLPPHVAHAAQLADKCKDEDRVSDERDSLERRHDSLERRRNVLGICLYVTSSHFTTASTLSAPSAPPTHATPLRAAPPPQTVHSSHDTALAQPFVT